VKLKCFNEENVHILWKELLLKTNELALALKLCVDSQLEL